MRQIEAYRFMGLDNLLGPHEWHASYSYLYNEFANICHWKYSVHVHREIVVTVFTALHRSSDENSVCPSVKRVHCDNIEEKYVQIFIPYERSFSQVFREEEWLVGATFSTWNFWSTGARWSEIDDFNRYSLVAPQPYNT